MRYEKYFHNYYKKIIGVNNSIENKKIIYADWAGSGRFYRDIEEEMMTSIEPFYCNMHSKETCLGNIIEQKYHESKKIIKNYFGVGDDYSVISTGFGMTSAIFKLQDILQQQESYDGLKPVVFLTIYEHNSNYLSWINRGYECVVIDNDENGQPDKNDLINK